MTITVKEFQMWLAGVEEMQTEGWSPDKRQWDRIREKINQLDTTVVTTQPQYVAPQGPVYRTEEVAIDPNRPIQYAEAGLPRVTAPPPNGALFGNSDNPAMTSKTPNIDTSNGQYQPAFL